MVSPRRDPRRRIAAMVVIVLTLSLGIWSDTGLAAGTLTTSAQALRVNLTAVGGLVTASLRSPNTAPAWVDGGGTASTQVLAPSVGLLGVTVLSSGVVTSTAGPAIPGGGRGESTVAGLTLLGATGISTGAIRTQCVMNASGISTDVSIADLKVGGATIASPDVNLKLNVPGVLGVTIDSRTAAWNTSTGKFDYTVRALDVNLLSGLAVVAGGTVVVAEAVCSGTIKLGTVSAGPVALAPGQSGTPTVTVTNIGDAGAPNTTIRIPKPPADYVLDTPTVTGGGTCSTADSNEIVCSGVTVPGGGSAKVSLPVRLKASAPSGAPFWSPGSGTIRVASTPVPEAPDQNMEITGSGALVTSKARATTGGTVTMTPATLPAGKTVTTGVKVANQGPSDASTTIVIPIANRPAGVAVTSAAAGGTTCQVDATAITCAGVTVPAGGDVTVDVSTSATASAAVGATWDLAGISAPMNGTAVTGQGRLLSIGSPDVNLAGGLTVAPATAIPGGSAATATIQVTNAGAAAATPASITIPAPPAGYTIGTVTTSGGGACVTGPAAVTCTGVTIPAGKAVTVSVPVTLASSVTAPWTVPAGTPITASAGNSTGTVAGTVVTPSPRYTLGVTATGPADDTVSPGQTTSITANVYNQGPSDARQSTFTVVAPPGTVFGTPSGATCASSVLNTRLTCTVDIAAGAAPVALTLPLTVSVLANPDDPVTGGCVSLDGDAACSGAGDAKLPDIVLRSPLATRLTTTFGAAVITPGNTGTGRVTLRSAKAETGVTATIPTNLMPAAFTVAGAAVNGTPCTIGAAAITCANISLAGNTPKDVAIQVVADPGALAGVVWTPIVTIATGGETAAATGPVAGTGTVDHTLTATASGPAAGTVEPGDPTSITVNVTNQGPSAASPAVFDVTAPAGASFGALSPPASDVCQVTTAALLTCGKNLARYASTGDLTIPLVISANADPDAPVTDGCVDVNGIPGCGAADRPIPDIDLRVPFARQAGVTADRADVVPGRTATATLHVAATHNDLTAVTVTIPATALPAGVTVTNATGPNGSSCAVLTGPNRVECTGIGIPAGTTADVRITVAAAATANPGDRWSATGITVAAGGQSLAANQELARVAPAQSTLDTTVALTGLVALPGGGGTLTVTLTNSGPSVATGRPITVIAPPGTTFGALDPSTDAACDLAVDATRATCAVDLAVGASASLAFPVKIGLNVLPGKAITGGCVDLDATSSCTVTVDKALPGITVGTPLQQRLTITTSPARIVPGEQDDARITIGSSAVEPNLTVTVPATGLPAGVSVIAASAPGGATCVLGPPVVCSNVAVPAPGTPIAVTLRVRSAAGGVAGTWTATGLTAATSTETATESGDLAVVGAPRSVLTGAVTVPGAGTVTLNSSTGVAVTVTNSGPSDANPAVFTVGAPAGTTFGVTMPANCARTGDTLVTCTMPLAAGATTGALTLPLVVPAGADPFTPLGGGCVDLDGVAGCGAGDRAIPDITLKVPFDRTVTLTGGRATVVPGRSGDATVTVTAERAGLTGITVSIPTGGLPAGLTAGTPAGATCTGTDPIECTGIDVTAGATKTITLPLTATASAAPGAVWEPVVTAGNGTDTIAGTRRLAVIGAADVRLAPGVTVPASIEPGRSGDVAVTLTNGGDSDATAVAYQMIPPAGAGFGTPPANCRVVLGTDRLACTATVAAGGTLGPIAFPLIVNGSAVPGRPITGGCVDLDDDGRCQTPEDTLIGPITVATPFDRLVSVRTVPATVSPASTGTAQVVIESTRALADPLTVTVPLGAKPASMTTGTPTLDQAGSCTADATAITCTGVRLSGGSPYRVTLDIPVTVAGGTPADQVWSLAGALVARNADDRVGGGGVLARTGAPLYTLGATAVVPATDTVLPGTTTSITATITATGSGTATNVPVTVFAPTGSTFPAAGLPAGCTPLSTTALSCTVTVAPGGSAPLTVPIVIPDPAPTGGIGDGCVDLGGDGRCDAGTDVTIPGFTLRTPLGSAVTAGAATGAPITPGRTGTATLQLAAGVTRDDMVLTIDGTGRPPGLAITGADVGGAACTISGDVVTCSDVDIAGGGNATLNLTVAAAPDAAPGSVWTPAIRLERGAESATIRQRIAEVAAADNGTGLAVSVVMPADGTVLPGGTAVLRVTMTNPGPSAMPGARAAFRAPTGTTFGTLDAPASTWCVKASATLVTCVADLGVEARLFRLPLDVPANTAPGAAIGAGGCVDAGFDGVCDPADAGLATFRLGKPFSSQAAIALTAAAVTPGDTATGVVRLTADRLLTGLTVTIPLAGIPAGLTVTSATGPAGSTCTLTGTIVCTGVSVPQATVDLVTVGVRAASSLAAGVTWTPSPVTVTSSAGDTSAATGVLARTGTPVSDLRFAPVLPDGTVASGGTAAMTIGVTNGGPSDAAGTVTRIKAPAGTTIGELDSPAKDDCVRVGATQLDCAVRLGAGAPALTWVVPVLVPANADPDTELTGGCIDTSRDGACGSGDTPLPGIHLTPTLTQNVKITADPPVIRPGRTGTIAVQVEATKAARTGLAVSIPLGTLPAGMTIAQAQVAGGACTVSTGTVSCTGVDVRTGGAAAVTLNAAVAGTATPGDTWTPTATVTHGGDQTARTLSVASVGAADTALTVAVAVPAAGALRPGDAGTMTATVTNTGSSAARAVPYTFLAPAGTTFTTPAATTGSSCAVSSAGARMTCAVDVNGNARTQIPLPFLVSGSADPRTPITGGCVDVNTDGVCDTGTDVTIPLLLLALSLAERVTVGGAPATVTPGRSGAGLVRITSTVTLTGTTVTVPLSGLPSGMTVTGVTGPAGAACTRDASAVTCTGVILAAGQNTDVAVTVALAGTLAPGAAWSPSAVTVALAGDSTAGAAPLIVAGPRESALTWRASGLGGTVTPGETRTLTVQGTNAGPSSAPNGTVAVAAPANSTFGPLSGPAAQDCTPSTSRLLSCRYALDPGGAVTWTFPVVVDAGLSPGARLDGGCVSADGDTTCGGAGDVAIDPATVDLPLRANGTISLTGATIAAGGSGTASVVISATTPFTGLTLTVPLTALPAGFTVTGATLDGTACPIAADAVTCTGVDLAARTARTLRLAVSVAASAPATAAWRATGITLADPDQPADVLTAAGLLAGTSTTASGYAVSVALGAPSILKPAKAQTTVLPITLHNAGPDAADPYPVTVVLPAGTTHGTLPAGCAGGSTGRTVRCTVSLRAGGTARIALPLVVDPGAEPGSVLTGGCLDQALAGTRSEPAFDLACGGGDDIAVPDMTVGRYDVDLDLDYTGGTVTAPAGGVLSVVVDYGNSGTETAQDVQFTIVPPAGVTVTGADLLIDPDAEVSTAALAEMVAATCAAATGEAANAVVCDAPDSAAESGSQLWIKLKVGTAPKAGVYPMKVTVSTTDVDGYTDDNTVSVPLRMAAADSDDGDDGEDDGGDGGDDGSDDGSDGDHDGGSGDLPSTGVRAADLAMLGALTVVTGASLVTVTREGGPVLTLRRLRESAAARRIREWIRRDPAAT
ncbi:hypothetical protein [Actinoplanes sp. NPDC023714]|uniref:beta strand repeat-containing protein n=1 Tax=Actinoplanes sp. NPDC023714 TaxID=3154322 RepID=UPI0033CED9B7